MMTAMTLEKFEEACEIVGRVTNMAALRTGMVNAGRMTEMEI